MDEQFLMFVLFVSFVVPSSLESALRGCGNQGNKARDRRQNRLLRKHGWTVVRVWQHELERKHVHRALRKLRAAGLAGDLEF